MKLAVTGDWLSRPEASLNSTIFLNSTTILTAKYDRASGTLEAQVSPEVLADEAMYFRAQVVDLEANATLSFSFKGA